MLYYHLHQRLQRYQIDPVEGPSSKVTSPPVVNCERTALAKLTDPVLLRNLDEMFNTVFII